MSPTPDIPRGDILRGHTRSTNHVGFIAGCPDCERYHSLSAIVTGKPEPRARKRPVRIRDSQPARIITSADLLKTASVSVDQAHGWITRAQSSIQCVDDADKLREQLETLRQQAHQMVLALREAVESARA